MSKIVTRAKKELQAEQSILRRFIVLIAVLLLLGSLWGWWRFVYASPRRVFWGMVDNALRTTTVTRTVREEAGGQQFSQQTYTITSPEQFAYGENTIDQAGVGGYDIATSLIGTPTEDYVQYRSVRTEQKTATGKTPDFSKQLNQWGKTTTENRQTSGQLYTQTVLGIVPFGNVPRDKRLELIRFMQSKNVYRPDYLAVKREIVAGRPQYSYEVKVSVEDFIAMLKKYAETVGLNHLEQVNPAEYRGAQPVTMYFDVDVWTRQLRSIRYQEGRRELYSFGARPEVPSVPKQTQPLDKIQQGIQEATR